MGLRLTQLPRDVLGLILRLLPLDQANRCRLVCVQFRQLVDSHLRLKPFFLQRPTIVPQILTVRGIYFHVPTRLWLQVQQERLPTPRNCLIIIDLILPDTGQLKHRVQCSTEQLGWKIEEEDIPLKTNQIETLNVGSILITFFANRSNKFRLLLLENMHTDRPRIDLDHSLKENDFYPRLVWKNVYQHRERASGARSWSCVTPNQTLVLDTEYTLPVYHYKEFVVLSDASVHVLEKPDADGRVRLRRILGLNTELSLSCATNEWVVFARCWQSFYALETLQYQEYRYLNLETRVIRPSKRHVSTPVAQYVLDCGVHILRMAYCHNNATTWQFEAISMHTGKRIRSWAYEAQIGDLPKNGVEAFYATNTVLYRTLTWDASEEVINSLVSVDPIGITEEKAERNETNIHAASSPNCNI